MKRDFKGLTKHYVVTFSLLKSARSETIEKTLDLFRTEDVYGTNTGIINRVTHLYRTDLEKLNTVVSELIKSKKFNSVALIHETSNLGFPYHIRADHPNGSTLYFDLMLVHITRSISKSSFNADQINKVTGGIPQREDEIFDDFCQAINDKYPNYGFIGCSIFSYYTIAEVNWNRLGLQRDGAAQVCLNITDPNYITITALRYSTWGKTYPIFFGDEKNINQMVSHDFFVESEIQNFIAFFAEKQKLVLGHQNVLKENFGGVTKPFFRILYKHNRWNDVKNSIHNLYLVMGLIEKGMLLLQSVEKLVANHEIFINNPRQIWLEGEERDMKEEVPFRTNHFFLFQVEDGKVLPNPETPHFKPFFANECSELKEKLEYLDILARDVYEKEIHLLSSFQTEFTLYALWFGIFSAIIGIISILISVASKP